MGSTVSAAFVRERAVTVLPAIFPKVICRTGTHAARRGSRGKSPCEFTEDSASHAAGGSTEEVGGARIHGRASPFASLRRTLPAAVQPSPWSGRRAPLLLLGDVWPSRVDAVAASARTRARRCAPRYPYRVVAASSGSPRRRVRLSRITASSSPDTVATTCPSRQPLKFHVLPDLGKTVRSLQTGRHQETQTSSQANVDLHALDQTLDPCHTRFNHPVCLGRRQFRHLRTPRSMRNRVSHF